jgi:hypothetical protein
MIFAQSVRDGLIEEFHEFVLENAEIHSFVVRDGELKDLTALLEHHIEVFITERIDFSQQRFQKFSILL